MLMNFTYILLHSNLSLFVTVPVTLLLHLGGLIPGLVVSD